MSPHAAIIAIFGPTGVGKTAVAVALADLLRESGEDPVAVSADALQVYSGLETLTGAPTAAERTQLEHRLVGIVPVTEAFSVGRFMPLAHAEIDAALAAGRRPIVVGGTGLYLRAALTDLELAPPPRPDVRARLERKLDRHGVEALHAELRSRAPAFAETTAPTDRTRVLRALEQLESDAGEKPRPTTELSQLWSDHVRRRTQLTGLVMERRALYDRIDARADRIAAAGALREIEAAERLGASRTVSKALGYEELLRGDVDAMRRRSRNYAKRQLTWMRKLAGIRVIDVTERDARAVADEVAAGSGLVASSSAGLKG